MEPDEKMFEPFRNWAFRAREHFKNLGKSLKGSDFQMRPLIVGFDGMPGTGKTTLNDRLSTYLVKHYQIGSVKESIFQVHDVSREDDPEGYRSAQYKSVLEELEKAFSGMTVVTEIDREIHDFVIWFNRDYLFKPKVNEEREPNSQEIAECIRLIHKVMEDGKGKVDVIILLTGDVETCFNLRQTDSSTYFMDSYGLKNRSPEATRARYYYYDTLYRELFLKASAIRSAVKQLVHIDVDKDTATERGKSGRNYSRIFLEAAAIINLHIVFKAWESVFLAMFGDELKASPRRIDSKRVIEFAKQLDTFLVDLRAEIVKPKGQIDPELELGRILGSYRDTEFVIARCGDFTVTVKNIFGNPKEHKAHQFQVYGL